jgi:hypothetical protein
MFQAQIKKELNAKCLSKTSAGKWWEISGNKKGRLSPPLQK